MPTSSLVNRIATGRVRSIKSSNIPSLNTALLRRMPCLMTWLFHWFDPGGYFLGSISTLSNSMNLSSKSFHLSPNIEGSRKRNWANRSAAASFSMGVPVRINRLGTQLSFAAAFACLVFRLAILCASSIPVQVRCLYFDRRGMIFGNSSKCVSSSLGLGSFLNISQLSVILSQGKNFLRLSSQVEYLLLRMHTSTPQKLLPSPVFKLTGAPARFLSSAKVTYVFPVRCSQNNAAASRAFANSYTTRCSGHNFNCTSLPSECIANHGDCFLR